MDAHARKTEKATVLTVKLETAEKKVDVLLFERVVAKKLCFGCELTDT